MLGLEICDVVGCVPESGCSWTCSVHLQPSLQAPLVHACWGVWLATCLQGNPHALKTAALMACVCRMQALTCCSPPRHDLNRTCTHASTYLHCAPRHLRPAGLC